MLRLSVVPMLVFALLGIRLDRSVVAAQTVAVSGVVRDSSGAPIPNVEVAIAQLSKSTRTASDGRYRLEKVPRGTHLLIARRVGLSAWRDSITVGAEPLTIDMVLRATPTTLDSVSVVDRMNDPGMDEFDEHRRLGLGHFITSAELRKVEGLRMASVLTMVSGVGLISGIGGEAWLLSKRAAPSFGGCTPNDNPRPGGKTYVPTKGEAVRGIRCACYAQVYLDYALMNPGLPTDPFNVNEIPIAQIEAIEFYAGPAQTPSKYMRLGSPCGVYVIHTRRPHELQEVDVEDRSRPARQTS